MHSAAFIENDLIVAMYTCENRMKFSCWKIRPDSMGLDLLLEKFLTGPLDEDIFAMVFCGHYRLNDTTLMIAIEVKKLEHAAILQLHQLDATEDGKFKFATENPKIVHLKPPFEVVDRTGQGQHDHCLIAIAQDSLEYSRFRTIFHVEQLDLVSGEWLQRHSDEESDADGDAQGDEINNISRLMPPRIPIKPFGRRMLVNHTLPQQGVLTAKLIFLPNTTAKTASTAVITNIETEGMNLDLELGLGWGHYMLIPGRAQVAPTDASETRLYKLRLKERSQ
jgi:hypothetical protein